jgi:hypothetical protein
LKRRLVVYGCAVWLALFLLVGLSPWSSQAYGQWRYPNKVLETVKKKKKNKRTKKPPKPQRSKGTEVTELSEGPLMDRQKPGSHGKKKLKKNDRHHQPELNSSRQLPLKQKKKEKPGKAFRGRQKVKVFEQVKPGTHHSKRGLGPSLKYLEQGTQSRGALHVKKSAISEPGKGQVHSSRELRRHGRQQGSSSEGNLSIKRSHVKEPGVHYKDRPKSLSKRYESSTDAASFGGGRKVPKREILQPGTLHSNRKKSIGKQYSGYEAARHPGNMRIKRKHVREPGTLHSDRPKDLADKYRNSTTAASHRGSKKVRKREILQPGTHHSDRKETIGKKYSSYEGGRFAGKQKVAKNTILKPGTHHSDRKETIGKKYNSYEGGSFAGKQKVAKNSILKPGTHHSKRSASISKKYESTAAANYAGAFRVKKKYLKQPGTHHSDRKTAFAKQYSSTEGASFRGNIKALSRRQQARVYEKQSEKVHQFEGNIRIKARQRNMHPSAAARRNVVMRSRKQAEQRRSLHKWWNRLWSREQPEVVREKAPKPRHDKGENEIWENSRDW